MQNFRRRLLRKLWKTRLQRQTIKKESSSSAEAEKFSTKLTETERGRLERIKFVRNYIAQGITMRQAAKDLKMSRDTIRKYLQGDPQQLCRQHSDCNRVCRDSISQYMDCITGCVNKGMTPAEIHRTLISQYGYQGSFNSFYNHLARNAKQRGWTLNTQTHPKGHRVHAPQMVTRAGIFHYLWNHGSLIPEHKSYIWGQHSILFILERCIKEFRDIFHWQCVNRLHCFIDKYIHCGIKPLEAFVGGLLRDIDAVECAVSYDWSNGFVEGSNSRLKMVKRAMFGRCSHELLEAKMLLYPVYYC